MRNLTLSILPTFCFWVMIGILLSGFAVHASDCPQCAQYEKWLKESARVCGYHGARLPSIYDNDPVCVAWNKACNRQRELLKACRLARQKEKGARVRPPDPETCRHKRQRLIDKSPMHHAYGIIGWASAVVGEVEIDLCTGGVVPMEKKIPIRLGDCIRTGSDGRIKIRFQAGIPSKITGSRITDTQTTSIIGFGSLYLRPHSEACFDRFIPDRSDSEALVDLIKGKVHTFISGWSRQSSVRIKIGGTVCSIKGADVTDVVVSHQPSKGRAFAYVMEGHADMRGTQSGQKVTLKAGQKVTVEHGAFGRLQPLSQPEWDKLITADGLDFGESLHDRPTGVFEFNIDCSRVPINSPVTSPPPPLRIYAPSSMSTETNGQPNRNVHAMDTGSMRDNFGV